MRNTFTESWYYDRKTTIRSVAFAHKSPHKDRILPEGKAVWRVYLDNYDLLEKYSTRY